jgi:hypothetical protein
MEVRLPAAFYTKEDSWCSFLLEPNWSQCLSMAGRIRSIEKLNDLIGNRTRCLPVCSIVSQPTTLPLAHIKLRERCKILGRTVCFIKSGVEGYQVATCESLLIMKSAVRQQRRMTTVFRMYSSLESVIWNPILNMKGSIYSDITPRITAKDNRRFGGKSHFLNVEKSAK